MTPDELAREKRKGCWCDGKRKPCEYHEGYEDGFADLLDALEEAERRLGECEDAFEAAAARADELELMRQHEGWYERGEYRSGHAGAAGGGAGPGEEPTDGTVDLMGGVW
jgi:hypothetical protein